MRRHLLAFALTAMTALCWAQTLDVGLGAGIAGVGAGVRVVPEASVSLSNLAFGDGRLALALYGGLGAPAGLALELRRTESFGVVGNLITRGFGRFETGGFGVRLSAEGTLGPVAGGVALELAGQAPRPPDPWRLDPWRLDPWGVKQQDAARFLAAERSDLALGLKLTARYRAARTVILTAEPSIYLTARRGVGFEADLVAAFLRLIGPDDVRVLASGRLEPGGGAGYAALGLELDLDRPTWPTLTAQVWLGASSAGVWPGAGLELSDTVGAGRYRFAADAHPYRPDRAPLRAAASFETPLGEGSLEAEVAAHLGGAAPAARAVLSYQRSF